MARVPKHSTATGLPTGKGRLIADLSWTGRVGVSINGITLLAMYGTYEMPRHKDVARDVLLMRYWFPAPVKLFVCKGDV